MSSWQNYGDVLFDATQVAYMSKADDDEGEYVQVALRSGFTFTMRGDNIGRIFDVWAMSVEQAESAKTE